MVPVEAAPCASPREARRPSRSATGPVRRDQVAEEVDVTDGQLQRVHLRPDGDERLLADFIVNAKRTRPDELTLDKRFS